MNCVVSLRNVCVQLMFVLAVILNVSVAVSAGADQQDMDKYVSDLLAKMSVSEKIGQLNQLTIGFDVTGPRVSSDVEAKIKSGKVGSVLNTCTVNAVSKLQDMAVKESRLGIPILFGYDVIHGYRTIFPIPLAIASSWDMAAIEKSAQIAALESSADGLNWTFSPMVDIARDPRWGRISEGAGEDSYLGSRVAEAMVRGYQGSDLGDKETILACIKHFGLYGAAIAGRDYNTVDMSRLQMYEDYFPPYKAAVEAGAATVMSSFNDINGIPATANKWLLTDLLRSEWGFDGFVVTDYNAIAEMIEHGFVADGYHGAQQAIKAGVDMDMVDECMLNNLETLVREGKVSMAQIDQACRRILEAKYKLGLFADPYRYLDPERAGKEIFKAESREFARQMARESFVLLKNNDNVLPLARDKKIALVGPLAKSNWDMLGCWSAAGRGEDCVSVYDGIKNLLGGDDNLIFAHGADITDDQLLIDRLGGQVHRDGRSAEDMIAEAVSAADKADIVVAVVGEQGNMCGEAKSRSDISIPATQQRLLKTLKRTGKPLVIVLMNGRPMTLEWEDTNADAILETWFAGVEGGNAVADVLYGDYNPSGKLTATFPRNAGQIPIYYNHKNTGRPMSPGGGSFYRSAYLDVVNEPLYPFGYGLSYTIFNYSKISLSSSTLNSNGKIEATVTVKNVGKRAGTEVVQMYIRDMTASVTPAVKRLKGYKRVSLEAGESREVTFDITVQDLKFYNSELDYIAESGKFKVYIGTNSYDCGESEFVLE